jgi:hypothetical protein
MTLELVSFLPREESGKMPVTAFCGMLYGEGKTAGRI